MNLRLTFSTIVVCMATSSFGQLTNQRLFDTVPFMVDHYARRVAMFQTESVPEGRVIFLGNSITEGGQWKKLTGDTTVVNRGIGGDITFGVLKRLTEIIKSQPSKLFLLIGINDIGKDIPDAVIADNISKIIERFKKESPATIIYVHSILPVNPEVKNFPQHYDKNDHVKKANGFIRKVTEETHVNFIDINKVFADKRGLLNAAYSPDGLHLNAKGYEVWISHLKKIRAL
jgi:lysophospholipase L1-like esterase